MQDRRERERQVDSTRFAVPKWLESRVTGDDDYSITASSAASKLPSALVDHAAPMQPCLLAAFTKYNHADTSLYGVAPFDSADARQGFTSLSSGSVVVG